MAGEDIEEEKIAQKSEENIIGFAMESKHKQKNLRNAVLVLAVIAIIAVLAIAVMLILYDKPQNVMTPLDKESVEMKTAEMLSGIDGAFIYKYNVTGECDSLILHVYEYRFGELVDKNNMEIAHPGNGNILIVPDFENFTVKMILADDSSKLSGEIPIMTDVPEREYYGRSATEISETTDIKYGEEQALLALIYDNDEMQVPALSDLMSEETDFITINDYVYCFFFEFLKE